MDSGEKTSQKAVHWDHLTYEVKIDVKYRRFLGKITYFLFLGKKNNIFPVLVTKQEISIFFSKNGFRRKNKPESRTLGSLYLWSKNWCEIMRFWEKITYFLFLGKNNIFPVLVTKQEISIFFQQKCIPEN